MKSKKRPSEQNLNESYDTLILMSEPTIRMFIFGKIFKDFQNLRESSITLKSKLFNIHVGFEIAWLSSANGTTPAFSETDSTLDRMDF